MRYIERVFRRNNAHSSRSGKLNEKLSHVCSANSRDKRVFFQSLVKFIHRRLFIQALLRCFKFSIQERENSWNNSIGIVTQSNFISATRMFTVSQMYPIYLSSIQFSRSRQKRVEDEKYREILRDTIRPNNQTHLSPLRSSRILYK